MKFSPAHAQYLHNELYRVCDVLVMNGRFARQSLGEQHVSERFDVALCAVTEALCALSNLQQEDV